MQKDKKAINSMSRNAKSVQLQIALCNPDQTAGFQCLDRNAPNMTKMSLSGEANFRHFYFGQAVEILREETIKLPIKKLFF